MKYHVLSYPEEAQLEDQVERSIALGWKLHGGVSVAMAYDSSADNFFYQYAQAMTLDNEHKP